jgi:hypothetical protein
VRQHKVGKPYSLPPPTPCPRSADARLS